MSGSNDVQEKIAKLRELSPRQLQVLKLSCQKLSQDKIAKELEIKTGTVKKHMQNIRIKLRISGIPDGGTVVEREDVDAREYLLLEYCPLLQQLAASEEGSENSQEVVPPPQTSRGLPSPSWIVFAIFGGAGIVLIAFIIFGIFFRGIIDGITPTPTTTPTITVTATSTFIPTNPPTLTPSPTNTATATPTPTSTPTFTPVPPAIACGQSIIISNIFPQLTGQEPFWGPFENPTFAAYFTCEGVTDPDSVRSDPGVLRIVYQNTGNRNDFGYFGIGLNVFDASQFSELCFLIYANNPNQAFWLKVKDIHQIEGQIEVNVDVPNKWHLQCFDLNEYASQDVNLSQLENISLGFDPILGSVELWFDDFEFKQ